MNPISIISKIKQSCPALVVTLVLGLVTSARAGYFPVPLTPGSFTYDIVVESNYNVLPFQDAVNVTMDSGPGVANNTWYELGAQPLNAATPTAFGLPHAGSLVTNRFLGILDAGTVLHVYQMPPTYVGNDVVFVGNYTNIPAGFTNTYQTGSFIPTSPAAYTTLSLLLSAGNGPVYMTCVISYSDGSSQTNAILAPDWFGGYNSVNGLYTGANANGSPTPVEAFSALGRCTSGGFGNTGSATACVLWSLDLGLSNTVASVTNVGFTWNSGGRDCIFALSGSTGGNFSPITVSGYDGDAILEANKYPLPYTATMDNGTNINSGGAGANTWFEIGWDPANPTDGFPYHGSTITSITTGRQYQMATNYQGPMSILIDTNHQLANITPLTPQAFTAVSLLTCGASIGAANVMTNKIILQHADGVNETNTFFGFDWFDDASVSAGVPVVVAYQASGRVNFNSARSLNSEGSVNPRIFESQFQLLDTTSPITNIVCKYFLAGGGNWTTYVLAVAGTTDPVPVVIAPNQTPAAQNVYAGQTATFGAQVIFGTAPQYQWQEGTSFNGPFTNLTDGATGSGSVISGSATATLNVANCGSSDQLYYTCLVTNAQTTNMQLRTPAPLTILVSTNADMFQPNDNISDFGEVVASPAGLTLPNVVDGTMATYLNYGGSGNTTNGPFLGPVGIIDTPSIGNSIVHAIRFVNAVNAPTCDPADFTLDGSDDGINWTNIVPDTALNLPLTRNLNNTDPININSQALQEVDFANSIGYSSYRITINNVRTNSAANSMQIAEIQLLGSLSLVAPGVFTQPSPANQTLYVGATLNYNVVGNGPGPISYQWYQGANSINGATNTTYTKPNITVADSGSYSCVLSNAYGVTTSAVVNLTVISPSSTYASTVVADHPIAYYPMNEAEVGGGDNGVAMIDYVGSHDGTYTNVTLGITPGYSTNDPTETAAQFGELNTNLSYGGNISPNFDLSTPTNTDGAFSVEAWVQPLQQAGGFPTVAGGGIVCQGYGGGGETFALDTGGTSNSFRFYFRVASTGSINVNDNQPIADGNWHHVVGVLNETNRIAYLYVDGQLASSTALATNGMGIIANNAPTNRFTIGWRNGSTTNAILPSLQFAGNIDEVSVYNYALTSNQVQNHYLSSGIVPRLTVTPTNVIASEGTTATFKAAAYGSQPLDVQWYTSDGANPQSPIGPANSNNLVLANVSQGMNGNFYQFVATNTYGSITSPAVQLTVVSGPPILESDVQTPVFAYAGYPLSLSATFGGTQPLSYQWQHNSVNLSDNARITGSHSNVLTIGFSLPGDSGNYQLIVTNSQGSSQSSVAAVTVTPVLGFNGSGLGWSQQGTASGTLYQGNNVLELTFDLGNEANSSFFNFPVYVGAFEASFLYQVVNPNSNPADGVCFVVQNDPRGASALGGGGGSLGVSGITPSAELEFNIYNGNGAGGVGIALATNGAIGNVTFPSPIQISSGDVIAVKLQSINGNVSLMLQDTNSGGTFTAGAVLNIPAVVGSNTAFVGFTGADGGAEATQTITDFNFVSLVNLSASVSGNNIVLSWPAASGGYVLQQSPSVLPPVWTNVTNAVNTVGNENQVTVPSGGPQQFYQLKLTE